MEHKITIALFREQIDDFIELIIAFHNNVYSGGDQREIPPPDPYQTIRGRSPTPPCSPKKKRRFPLGGPEIKIEMERLSSRSRRAIAHEALRAHPFSEEPFERNPLQFGFGDDREFLQIGDSPEGVRGAERGISNTLPPERDTLKGVPD